MSIVRAKTNPYGPATLDIQIEQGADFYLPLGLVKAGVPWVLTGCTFEAYFSQEWAPGANKVDMTVTVVDENAGTINVKFPSADSLGLVLPHPPKKTVDPTPFKFGNWLLKITDPSDTNSPTKRLLGGIVYFERDPCRT